MVQYKEPTNTVKHSTLNNISYVITFERNTGNVNYVCFYNFNEWSIFLTFSSFQPIGEVEQSDFSVERTDCVVERSDVQRSDC